MTACVQNISQCFVVECLSIFVTTRCIESHNEEKLMIEGYHTKYVNHIREMPNLCAGLCISHSIASTGDANISLWIQCYDGIILYNATICTHILQYICQILILLQQYNQEIFSITVNECCPFYVVICSLASNKEQVLRCILFQLPFNSDFCNEKY